jgi:site-specific DNA recombinase
LAKLATEYLRFQRQHWPELIQAGLLPDVSDGVITTMVEDFKHRHRAGQVDPGPLQAYVKLRVKLGGSYNRYSCDNSSPASIIDQMIHGLDKARGEDRFVPWAYVFADYSVSGLDCSRQGYTSYKSVLGDDKHWIETTYVDDFTRASRDEIEWWKLATLSKRLKKRMMGASDGFDLSAPDWDVKVTIYGLISRLFIKGLREKVKRGMRGAARRRTCLGKQSLGFTRCVCQDENGNIIYGADGRPIYRPCVDPATADYRRLLYELYTQKRWPPHRIVKHFNELKVDGWDGWTDAAVKKLLWSAASIGVFIWNRTRREFDWEKEKWVVVKNPRSQWEVYHDPKLAQVPMEWWKEARRRLMAARRKSPLTGRKPSRNQVSATTLFSGTLFCEHCGDELKLIRSAPKYKQMGCLNGLNGARGCKLSASKSTRVIEECLLGYLRDAILTESLVHGLVANTNALLEEEARKPQVNTAPLKAEARKRETKISRLVRKVEETDDAELSQGYHKRIVEVQKDLNRLYAEIRDAEPRNRKSVKPLEIDQVNAYLADIQELLSQEITVAAEAIRTLTGSIKIRQEPISGKTRGARWIATFSPDLLRVLRFVARENSDSSLVAIDHGEEPQVVEVPIEKVPAYEKLAPEFKRLRAKGASIQSIASAHGMSWQYAAEIIHFAETGERPKWRVGTITGTGPAKPPKYPEIAQEVAHLRDQKKMSFLRIAEKLVVSESTVRRAYDLARPEIVREAAERGEIPRRGRYSHLGEDKYQMIRQLLGAGEKPVAIAASVGCGTRTVYRIWRQMRGRGGGDQASSPVAS